MINTPTRAADVNAADWKSGGSDYVVVGRVSGSGDGQLAVDFDLVNTLTGQTIATQRFTGPQAALRNAAHRAIFHLLEEPVPALAEPFPEQDPLPGAYRLHLPSDGLTIWYTITQSLQAQVVIVVQYVKADT